MAPIRFFAHVTQICFSHDSVNSTKHMDSINSDLCEQSYRNPRDFYVTLDQHSSNNAIVT